MKHLWNSQPNLALSLFLLGLALTPRLASAELYNWSTQAKTVHQSDRESLYPKIDGSGVALAIMDSGADLSRPWLSAGSRKIKIFDFRGGQTAKEMSGAVNFDNVACNHLAGHGTGAASFATANGPLSASSTFRGIAPNANLVILRIDPCDGSSFKRALDWLVSDPNNRGISVINASLGYGTQAGSVSSLINNGVFFSIAAGNDGHYISSDAPVVQVGGTNGDGTAPAHQGSLTTGGGPGVDIVAPAMGRLASGSLTALGLWIAYTGAVQPSWSSMGTSWSAPQVAGAATLLYQINPNTTQSEVLSILRSTADRSVKDTYGVYHPLLNVAAAVKEACRRTPSTICGNSTNPPPKRLKGAGVFGGTTVSPPPPTSTTSPDAKTFYYACPKATPSTTASWIRDSYISNSNNPKTLGCMTDVERAPNKCTDGRFAWQTYANSGYCLAWDWSHPLNYKASNYIIRACKDVPGWVAPGVASTTTACPAPK